VSIFRLDETKEFLEGEREGVSVLELGGLGLAPAIEELGRLEEPYIFSAAVHPEGWVVGTGNAGKVLKVDRDGRVEELFSAPEHEIFAVWADPDGTVFAGTSPNGQVYRIRAGEAEPFFDPEQAYIWGLARGQDGQLLVATGLNAALYAVDAEGKGRTLASLQDGHLRSLAVLEDGGIVLGTAGQGRVLALAPDGALRTLYDAAQPEVVAFAPLPDGSFYVAILASEASLVDLKRNKDSSEDEDEEEEDGAEVEDLDEDLGAGSRSASFDGSRSILVHVSSTGEAEEVLAFENETIYSLLWAEDSLWIGTGLEGKLFSYADDVLVLERELEAKQIVALLPGRDGTAVVTTNVGAVHRLASKLEQEGAFTSAILDADAQARFGSFYWRGEIPKKSSLAFRFRSGVSAEPDATWSPWSDPETGRELNLSNLSKGRFVQWQAMFEGDGEVTPRLRSAELSYQQENQKPKIKTLEVLDPGKILVPSSFNMATQAYEPWSARKDGIFTSLKATDGEKDVRLKGLWKLGYRTLRWKADDGNKDRLRYRLSFRAEGHEAEWLPLVEDLKDSYYSFDSTVLPDGYYRFRLEAVDRPVTEEEDALRDFKLSEPAVVDHSPPRLVAVERSGTKLDIRLRDQLSPIRRAEYSLDAGPWIPARALDGLIDGRQERVQIEASEGASLILLRVMDAALNVVTYDLQAGLPE
jgi:sugar lactone lactonase YvrE